MIKFSLKNTKTLHPSIELSEYNNVLYLTIDEMTILSVGITGRISLIDANIRKLFGDCKVISSTKVVFEEIDK